MNRLWDVYRDASDGAQGLRDRFDDGQSLRERFDGWLKRDEDRTEPG